MNSLLTLLSGFGSPPVLLVGDFMLDRYVYGDVERISPEAPVPVLKVGRSEIRAGGAGSVAAALQALGAHTLCVGAIGDDAEGEQLREALSATGADVSGLLASRKHCTTVKTRYVGLAQQKSPHQMLRVDSDPAGGFGEELSDRLKEAYRGALGTARAVAVQDHNKGVVTAASCAGLVADAADAGVPVIIDPARIPSYERYRGASVITPNRWESAFATGITIAGGESLGRAAARLLDVTAAGTVAVTLDKDGIYVLESGSTGQMIGTRPRTVYDATGAGDETLAMMAVAIAEGCTPYDAAGLANVAGGLEIEQFGVVPIARQQVIEELQRLIGLCGIKVMGRGRLENEIARRRRNGETIVFTNGCFDLLHMGHVRHLRQARELGTCLVVAINSDEGVRRLKGEARPVIGQDERAEILAALECVDYVTVFDEDTPIPLLELLQPDVLVKGGDTDTIVGSEIVEQYGGTVRRLEKLEGPSTTEIISRITEQKSEEI